MFASGTSSARTASGAVTSKSPLDGAGRCVLASASPTLVANSSDIASRATRVLRTNIGMDQSLESGVWQVLDRAARELLRSRTHAERRADSDGCTLACSSR